MLKQSRAKKTELLRLQLLTDGDTYQMNSNEDAIKQYYATSLIEFAEVL
jgi:hypothetical protein